MGSHPWTPPPTSGHAVQRRIGGPVTVRRKPSRGALPVRGVIARTDLLSGRKDDLAAVGHQMDRQGGTALGDDAKASLVIDQPTGGRGLELAVGSVLTEQLRVGDPASAAADAGGLVDVEFLNHGHSNLGEAAGRSVKAQIVAQHRRPLTLIDRNPTAIEADRPTVWWASRRPQPAMQPKGKQR